MTSWQYSVIFEAFKSMLPNFLLQDHSIVELVLGMKIEYVLLRLWIDVWWLQEVQNLWCGKVERLSNGHVCTYHNKKSVSVQEIRSVSVWFRHQCIPFRLNGFRSFDECIFSFRLVPQIDWSKPSWLRNACIDSATSVSPSISVEQSASPCTLSLAPFIRLGLGTSSSSSRLLSSDTILFCSCGARSQPA